MIVYVEHISERLIYTFDFIFKDQGIPYHLTNDLNHFLQSAETKLNYSSYPADDILTIVPAELLFDETLKKQKVTQGNFNGTPCLAFSNISDPFASIFYILSRYEEYLDFTPDNHNRFRAQQSVLSQFDWLQNLTCERWTRAIINFLNVHNILKNGFEPLPLKVIPTFDIDNSFAYKHKHGWRRFASTVKDLLARNNDRIVERKAVLSGQKADPYDTFPYIQSIANRGFDVKIFWHLGDYGKFDTNLSYLQPDHQNLIRSMATNCEIGIHPSYASNSKPYLVEVEKKRLATLLQKDVKIARQHFLKLSFPDTYENYLKSGIKEDYTLGYAQKTGFRSGTLRPHFWFNLKRNLCTELILHPFAYMDGTLCEYEQLSIEQAKHRVRTLYTETKQFGGNFVFLWHNETINDYKKWKGWTQVLEYTLSLNTNDYE